MSGPFGSSQWMYASGGFYPHEIDQSLRMGGGDGRTGRLKRTPSSTGNRQTFTLSWWIKRNGRITNDVGIFYASDGSNEGDSTNVINFKEGKLQFRSFDQTARLISNAVFRDTSAWYHFVVIADTTNGTADDRMRMYVNGDQITSFDTRNNPSQNLNFGMFNTQVEHGWGALGKIYTPSSDYYLAECHFIDGQAYDPSYFGETKEGIWIPKNYTGSYGTNGFKLAFQDSSSLGDDTSGNGHDFTSTDLSAEDQVLDSPTNNFATLRLSRPPASSGANLSEGNLKYTTGTTGGSNDQDRSFLSTILTPTTGKWYAEYLAVNANFTAQVNAYQGDQGVTGTNTNRIGIINTGLVFETRTTGTATSASYGGSFTSNDVIQVFVDMDNDPPRVAFGKNGSWGDGSGNWNQSNPSSYREMGSDFLTDSTDSPGQVAFTNASIGGGSDASGIANFGQDSTFAGAVSAGSNTDANGQGEFKYAVPSDALALCTANLPDPGIDPNDGEDPADYFTTVLYTGDGSDGRSVTGVGFDPDWVWLKSRNLATSHLLTDRVRGAPATLFAEANFAESNSNGGGFINAFVSDGFTVTSGASGDNAVNDSSDTYVAWNWLAGGSASTLSDGSINVSASVSAKSGFSILTYTGNATNGATIAHGLNSRPELVIFKNRSRDSRNWQTNFIDGTARRSVYLNLTSAESTPSSQQTLPTDSLITLDAGNDSNQSGDSILAYCFANVSGYQKIGQYTGNGDDDGPFINVGFRPAWVIVKRTDSTNNWFIFDSVREPLNESAAVFPFLRANISDAEASNVKFEFNSTAFKPRDASAGFNASGGTYLYLAIAEQPFKFANAR